MQIRVVWVYFFYLQSLATWERETQFLRAYANHTILSPPHTRVWHILWSLRSQLISAGRDPNWSALIRSEKIQPHASTIECQLICFFKILKFSALSLLGMTSTTHWIHSNSCPQPYFLSGGLLWQTMIVISFPRGRKIASSDYCTWTKRRRVVQSLTKLNKT